MEITRVGEVVLGWGESLVWDEERTRLYFVDCAASTLHWLEDGESEPHTLQLQAMPTGVVPTDQGTLAVALEDGIYVVDPDSGTTRLLVRYPAGMGGRANDACADLSGNLITGKLNLTASEGSAWWYSTRRGWRLLDPRISNTNGPAAGVIDGEMTLVIGDSAADYFSYPYDPNAGVVGERTTFGDVQALEGSPDGATLDTDGGLWCALVGGGQLARFTGEGLDRTVPLPCARPADVTFGGRRLDRLFVVSIGLGPAGPSGLDGALLVVDGLGQRGRPEPRLKL